MKAPRDNAGCDQRSSRLLRRHRDADAGWWEALWPDPAGVLAAVGLKPGMEVIDLCSGDGWFTLQIAKIARHVVAIDIDRNLLEVARHRLNEGGVTNCEFRGG